MKKITKTLIMETIMFLFFQLLFTNVSHPYDPLKMRKKK